MARWDQSYSAPKTTPSEGALVIHLPHRRLYKFVVCLFFFNENDTRFVCLESDSLPSIPGGSASHQWLRSITWNYTTTTNWVIRSKTSRIMVWRWGKSSSQQNKYLAGENCFKKKSQVPNWTVNPTFCMASQFSTVVIRGALTEWIEVFAFCLLCAHHV